MSRTMKPRLSAYCLPAIVLVGLGVASCDALTSVDTRLQRATKALGEGNPEAALSDARAVVEKEPARPEAWLLLTRISLKYGDGPSALKDLERAAKAGASESELQPLRDEAMLAAGQFQKLLDSTVGQSGKPDHLVALARAAASLDHREKAQSLVEQALAAEPTHLDARLLQVRLSQASGNLADASTLLARVVGDSPKSAEALLLQGQLALVNGDAAAAAKSFASAEPLSKAQLPVPSQVTLLAALVESHLAAGDVPAAAAALGRLKRRAAKWPVTDLLSARVSLAQRDATSAVATLQSLLGNQPENEPARLLLGAALLEQGAIEQARSHLTKLIAERPENMEARKLLARLHASQGDLPEAERVLSDLPTGVTADPTADWMRSALLSMSGNRTEALALLQQAARADTGNVALQLDLVRAYLGAGRRDEANALLKTIPPQKTGWAGKQLQVLGQVLGQPEAEARRSLSALATQNPRDAELRTIIGQVHLQANDLAAATEQFRGALSVNGKLAEARMGLAGVFMRQGNLDSARTELREVLTADSRNERASLALAAIAIRQSKADEARQQLETAIAANPAAVESRLALAELSLRDKDAAKADALLTQALGVTRDKSGTQVRVGDIQFRAGNFAKAAESYAAVHQQHPASMLAIRLSAARKAAGQQQPEAVLRDWLKRQPDDVMARAALAEHLLQSAAMREAIAEYETALKVRPAPVLLNNLAWAYQQVGDARAETTARRAYEGAPGNPAIADTYGYILLQKNRVSDALPLLKKAAEALPGNADVQAHYNQAKARTEKP
jgi:putative PEP-CTERM system TPR-repeat lipoprotein